MQRFILMMLSMFIALLLITTITFLLPDDELPPIKIGILHSLSGTMAISEKPVVNATLLAIEQINAQGGLLGRKIEPVITDGKSDWPTFARQAERLITQEKVSVVFGCWTSASRKTVKPIFEKYNHLLFYPVQYEGLEQSSNIVYTGAAPNQQIIPAISWTLNNLGTRLYLVGSDYVFPRVANWLIKKQTPALKGKIIAESYLPLGSTDVKEIIADIQRLQPDVIINTINGDSNIAFFQALTEAGIRAKDIPVVSFSIGEAELAQMSDDTVGHYAAWNYFQSIDNQANKDFIHAYQTRFGKDLPISDPMEAAWSGVQLWAKAVLTSQTFDAEAIRQSIAHQSIVAPEGIISVDHQTLHVWKTVRIGKILANKQFEILWSSKAPVRPDPYPAIITQYEAKAFLQELYTGWGNHWAKPPKHGDAKTHPMKTDL